MTQPGLGREPKAILNLQRAAGNKAVAQLLGGDHIAPSGQTAVQRWKEGSFSSLIPDFVSNDVQDIAEGSINNPIMTKCIRHYRDGEGKPLHLTEDEVQQMWVQADLFGKDGFPQLKGAQALLMGELQKRRTEQEQKDPESKQAGFTRSIDTAGMDRPIVGDRGLAQTHALGTATMIIYGLLSYSERVGFTFKGTFTLFDRWDFDLQGFSSHRGAKNEMLTWVGRFGLKGQPFDVTTDPLPLEKNQRDDSSIVREEKKA